jgi:hypothetical protein
MNTAKHRPGSQALRLLTTVLRAWAVGFVLAARGTVWLLRKSLGLLPFGRSKRTDEGLID